jgi:hypothetical protein
MTKKLNDKLTGMRGLLTILSTWAMLFADTFSANITGLSQEALKAAFIASAPITVKLIWTDLRPKLMEFLK